MSRHTPGPRKVVNQVDVQSGPLGGLAYVSTAGARGRTLDEAQANARLIAAAPELLAACEAAREWHEATGLDRRPQWDEAAWERNGELYGRWLALVESAIAKARGVTSSPAAR